jgi:OTU-like cysteine protease
MDTGYDVQQPFGASSSRPAASTLVDGKFASDCVSSISKDYSTPRDVAHIPDTTGSMITAGNTEPRFIVSHHQLLCNAAEYNNGYVVETVSAGDCFFDAVRIGLYAIGIQRSVKQIREMVGIELQCNAAIYRQCFDVEVIAEHEQAETFDEFVDKTWHGSEWATELTVLAVARALGVIIQVISTSGSTSTTFDQFYGSWTGSNDVIVTVLYNAEVGHYLGYSKRREQVNVEDNFMPYV